METIGCSSKRACAVSSVSLKKKSYCSVPLVVAGSLSSHV